MTTSGRPTGADPTADHPDHEYHDLKVARVIEETADARSIVFEIPSEFAATFRYDAGQFLTLQIPYDGKNLVRCYSLASSPDCESEHKVTIKRVDDGRISNWINDNLREGDVVRVLPPGGLFTLNDGDNPIFLFGGGSGITPVISIIKSALVTSERRLKLFYANRDDASIIFRSEIDDLVARHPGRLEVVHRLDVVDGFIDSSLVNREIEGWHEAEFYICGPGPFMEIVVGALRSAGIDDERVHVEEFVSPPDPGEVDEDLARRAAEIGEEGAPTRISVFLDGTTHELPYERGQTVLATVQKAGLEPPFSCTEGFCGCCMAKLTAGRVEMINNDFLSKKELEDGWVLTCQSVPVTPDCSVEYPD